MNKRARIEKLMRGTGLPDHAVQHPKPRPWIRNTEKGCSHEPTAKAKRRMGKK